MEYKKDGGYAHEMSLRDYFAGKALQGLVINPSSASVACPIATRAYELADAMLKAREK